MLLVEDNPSVCEVVDRQLRSLGCEVVAVATGHEAIRLVTRGAVVDVLLTDMDLPDVNGVVVARAVTGASPATHVVFMSGSVPRRSLEPRGAPFLLKPFSRTALAAALGRQPL